ncbi:hypothetical protein ACM1PE_22670 [Achromobacter sp. PD1]|uniref:hypothetical protein n=1 Tax=Achromobacter sp. PD1 TaxID=3399125 RepID=UPI003AF4A830
MHHVPRPRRTPGPLTSFYWSGDAMRSRSVSGTVLAATLDVPAPPARLQSDWEREMATRLRLEPGDVEQMPLARTQARWPEYGLCLQAMRDWTQELGLPGVLANADIALMACRGARYHHDGGQYGGAAFCNLFLSEDRGLDVHFPAAGLRVPLVRGTAMIFDTCQPHAVIPRGTTGFREADFAAGLELAQLFLTWELPVEDSRVASALGLAFDVDPATAARLDEEQVRMDGARAAIDPECGRWLAEG